MVFLLPGSVHVLCFDIVKCMVSRGPSFLEHSLAVGPESNPPPLLCVKIIHFLIFYITFLLLPPFPPEVVSSPFSL